MCSLIWLVLLALMPLCVANAQDLSAAGTLLTRASFQFGAAAPREVRLPHTWASEGLPNAGGGRYRVEIELSRLPEVSWSLGADRLSSRCAIRINGALIRGDLPLRKQGQRAAPVPTLVDLPTALLRVGPNVIDIDVEFDARGGMSALLLGPTDVVRRAYARAETFGFTLPQSLNVGATVLALFMLTIWLRRRSEAELGAVSGLMCVVSIRNIVATGVGNDWHGNAVDFAIYAAQVLTMVLLAWFGLAFSRRDWRAFRRIVNVVGVTLLLIGLLAFSQGEQLRIRVWAYPLVFALTLPSVWLIFLGARSSGGARQLALTFAITMFVAAGVHDYLFLRGFTSVMDRYWMPFTSPLAMLLFAWALLDRFVAALGAMETQAGELERQVAMRTRELEVASAAKTRFIAAASHDLRQPVVSISLLSELLREQKLPAAADPILARMGDSVQALNALLKGLLDLSRFDAGAVRARRERVALGPLLDRAAADEDAEARRKGITLRVRVGPIDVDADPVLLEQIVRNLVSNAVRYTTRGGVLVAARRRKGDRVRVEVWDTGPGIAPHSQTRVFEEFVQLDNDARQRRKGLGLGLSIVQRAAAVLGTRVELRSAVGRGSRFSIELPLAGPALARPSASPADDAHLLGLPVWMVEDDAAVRESLRLRLAGWGADVREFADVGSVRQALADSELRLPALLITDQRLPDGTGLQVAQMLQAAVPGLRVLIVSGDTAPEDIARLLTAGLPMLHKPFTSEELRAALHALEPVRT